MVNLGFYSLIMAIKADKKRSGRIFMKNFSAAALLLSLTSPLAFADSCDSLAPLSWLTGGWTSQSGQVSIKESWQRLSDNTFDGISVTSLTADAKVLSDEQMRLVDMGDSVFLIAKVVGNDLPTSFKLTSCNDNKFTFENHWHDFPKVISYQFVDDNNVAVVVSDARKKTFNLAYKRVVK